MPWLGMLSVSTDSSCTSFQEYAMPGHATCWLRQHVRSRKWEGKGGGEKDQESTAIVEYMLAAIICWLIYCVSDAFSGMECLNNAVCWSVSVSFKLQALGGGYVYWLMQTCICTELICRIPLLPVMHGTTCWRHSLRIATVYCFAMDILLIQTWSFKFF